MNISKAIALAATALTSFSAVPALAQNAPQNAKGAGEGNGNTRAQSDPLRGRGRQSERAKRLVTVLREPQPVVGSSISGAGEVADSAKGSGREAVDHEPDSYGIVSYMNRYTSGRRSAWFGHARLASVRIEVSTVAWTTWPASSAGA